MRTFDFFIAGSGPAGSYTALKLVEKGFSVALIDKKKFPRDKLCGGCLSKRIVPLLPEGWEHIMKNKIKGGILKYKNNEHIEKTDDEDIAYIVKRKEFDFFLLKKAIDKGISFYEECEVLGFEERKDSLLVNTSTGGFKTKYLIGADGFFSTIRKKLGYRKRKFYRAVEIFIEGNLRNKVIIEIGYVKRGYLWIFPAGDGKVSIGIASTGKENLYFLLKRYVEEYFGKKIHKVKGWFIPFAEKEEDIQYGKERIILVGDSANMTDPLLGEGIYYSMLAGKLLSESAYEDFPRTLSLYKEKIRTYIVEEFLYAGKISKLAYKFQKASFYMGKGTALADYIRLLKGEETYKNLYRKGIYSFLLSLVKSLF